MKHLSLFTILLVICLILTMFAVPVLANNIQVANTSTTNFTTTGAATTHYCTVEFNLSWDNSWRSATNYDAAWVFIKYRTNSGDWQHATINATGHTAPAGATITPADNLGAFIYRDANGTGTNTWIDVGLRWNYGANSVVESDTIHVEVCAIEMVYIPEAGFSLGSGGTEAGHFHVGNDVNTPYSVASEDDAITVGTGGSNLYYLSGANAGDRAGPIPADFPKGYAAFYCMKYEMSQQQYVEFLNMLTRSQQNARTGTALSSSTTSVTNRYVMSDNAAMQNRNGIRCDGTIDGTAPINFYNDFNGNGTENEAGDGQDPACNWLSWADGAAYADWSGLRPMTELEFEKACRGNQATVANEYAWGNTTIASATYTIGNDGQPAASITGGYAPDPTGNASYSTTDGAIDGPLRCGIFSDNNSTRAEAGAGYYGVMELSGNVFERPITIGNNDGRAFTGVHGDGSLDGTGNADAANWPAATTASGVGFRGGSWGYAAVNLRASDRNFAAFADAFRNVNYGFRCVRSSP